MGLEGFVQISLVIDFSFTMEIRCRVLRSMNWIKISI